MYRTKSFLCKVVITEIELHAHKRNIKEISKKYLRNIKEISKKNIALGLVCGIYRVILRHKVLPLPLAVLLLAVPVLLVVVGVEPFFLFAGYNR
jgi:hypothetical protein